MISIFKRKATVMNAVVLAVIIMLGLSIARVNVVISLVVGALVGGWWANMELSFMIETFQKGLSGGAKIALTYALLGVFAVSLSHSGLPQAMANFLIQKTENKTSQSTQKIKYLIFFGILLFGLLAETIIPVHIAFIFMIIPPLLTVLNKLDIDRRMMACIISFGLVTGYMMFPIGFGNIYLNDILLGRIAEASPNFDVKNISAFKAMLIPGLGMFAGVLIAVFFTYRKPRHYQNKALVEQGGKEALPKITPYRAIASFAALAAVFYIQVYTEEMLMAALVGILIFMATGVVHFKQSERVFDEGVRMMAMIGLIMISACGFAAIMEASGAIEPLVSATAEIFQGSKPMAAFAMLLVGLLITLGIGSSFSTIPVIAAIYVPLCAQLGFSPLATVAIIGTAGALGDTGSPASDSTLGPTAGLNLDGQHDHIRDTVIPTFIHFNIPLLLAGWVAAMVL